MYLSHFSQDLSHCDRILVLRKGQIGQDGTYADLEATPGLFQELVQGDKDESEFS